MGAGQTRSARHCCSSGLQEQWLRCFSEPEVVGVFNYRHFWRHHSNSKGRWEEQLFSQLFMESSSRMQFLVRDSLKDTCISDNLIHGQWGPRLKLQVDANLLVQNEKEYINVACESEGLLRKTDCCCFWWK